MKLRNLFYLILFKILFSNLALGTNPILFYNDNVYDGGICFANSILQSLFQFSSFRDFVSSSKDKNLKDFYFEVKQDKIVSAWNFVKDFYTYPNPYTFLEDIINKMNFNSHYFFYFHDRFGCFSAAKSNNSFTYNKVKNNSISYLNYKYNTDLDFLVVPNLNLLAVRIIENDFNKFNLNDLKNLKKEQSLFKEIWAFTENDDLSNSYFKLKSIIPIIGKKDAYHVISYIDNNYEWMECNDFLITNTGSIDNVFSNIKDIGFTKILMFELNEKENPFLKKLKKVIFSIKNFIN